MASEMREGKLRSNRRQKAKLRAEANYEKRTKPQSEGTMDQLTTLTDDILFHILSFSGTHDLMKLALSCRRFGGKPAATDGSAMSEAKRRKIATKPNVPVSLSVSQAAMAAQIARLEARLTTLDPYAQGKGKGKSSQSKGDEGYGKAKG